MGNSGSADVSFPKMFDRRNEIFVIDQSNALLGKGKSNGVFWKRVKFVKKCDLQH